MRNGGIERIAAILDGMHEKPGKRWRPRFTLLGLLAFTALCAGVTQYLVWQRNVARRDLQRAQQIYDEGLELIAEEGGDPAIVIYCQDSERLCKAECRIPLADKATAVRAHLERIKETQRRYEAFADIAMWASSSGSSHMRKVLAAYRQRADQMAKDAGIDEPDPPEQPTGTLD